LAVGSWQLAVGSWQLAVILKKLQGKVQAIIVTVILSEAEG